MVDFGDSWGSFSTYKYLARKLVYIGDTKRRGHRPTCLICRYHLSSALGPSPFNLSLPSFSLALLLGASRQRGEDCTPLSADFVEKHCPESTRVDEIERRGQRCVIARATFNDKDSAAEWLAEFKGRSQLDYIVLKSAKTSESKGKKVARQGRRKARPKNKHDLARSVVESRKNGKRHDKH